MPVPSAKGIAARKSAGTAPASSAGASSSARTALAGDEIITDEMVPDPNFAAVLNDNLEVRVGNQLIKITIAGTYSADAANRAALEYMANDNSLDSADYTPGRPIGDKLYDMGNGITRYDTFEADTTTSLKPLPDPDDPCPTCGPPGTGGGTGTPPPSSSCGIAQPASPAFPSAMPAGTYCAFPSYLYGSHTFLGGVLQGLFGVNSSRENNFDSNHRIKVKLYSFNYLVYASIGLKAKFQEKSFGIWGKKDCPKIVLGWDAVVFEAQQAYSAAGPVVPTFNTSGLASVFAKSNETYQFINFRVPAEMISELSSSLVGRYGVPIPTPTVVENKLTNLASNQLASVTSSLWTYVTTTYAPGQLASQNAVTKGFRMIFPDKVTTALSRWEQVSVNTGEVDLIFDWNTAQLTYSNTVGGNVNFVNNVLVPTYTNQAKSYEVKKASVYGAALYNGAWKGVRIIQE